MDPNPGKREIKEWSIYTYQVEGDKCYGGMSNIMISKYIILLLGVYAYLFFITGFLE